MKPNKTTAKKRGPKIRGLERPQLRDPSLTSDADPHVFGPLESGSIKGTDPDPSIIKQK